VLGFDEEGPVDARLMSALLGGWILLSGGSSAQASDQTMTVLVTAAEVVDVGKIDSETQRRLRAAIKDAQKGLDSLDKTLSAQHGKKREAWPPDAVERYYDAEEAVAVANADYAYRRVKQSGLSDSAEDIRKSIVGDGMAGKKEHVTLVTTRDEAQVIIEVNGRRSGSSGTQGGLLAGRDDLYWISFLIKPGPRLAADRLAAVPRTYRFKRVGYSVWRLAIPRPDSPEWRFEAFGNMRWGNAANVASVLIEDFIGKNHDAMTMPGAVK
jgi:hypothetical protein